jgi:hypothetical protein
MEHAICKSIYVQVLTNLHLNCFVLSNALRWRRNQNVGTTLAAAWGGTLILVMPSTLGVTYHISHHLGVCTVYILAKFEPIAFGPNRRRGGCTTLRCKLGLEFGFTNELQQLYNSGVFRTFAPIMKLKDYVLLFSFQTSCNLPASS